MAGKIIQPLSDTATKSEEMDWLMKVIELVAPGTYLSSLFSHELVQHIGNAIRQDMSCDLYDDYAGAVKEAGRFRAELMQQAAEQKAAMQAQERLLQSEITRLSAELADRDRTIARNQERIERDHESITAILENKYAAQREAQEANERAAALEEEVKLYELQVLKLKSKMYDLQNPA